jgi:type I restriction enzyme, S subunit
MENDLPKGWVYATIQEIAFTASGGTPSTNKKEYWENGNIPWINSGTLKDTIISKPSHYITEHGLKNSSAKLFPKDSVLIALTGATTGRVGILDFQCSANQSVTALYPSINNCPKYLYYFLLYSRADIVGMSLGSAQPHINKYIVDHLKIPIPPLGEQNRIVTKLNALFEKLESNKQRLERIPQILKRFRQSVLTAAVSGKLTELWRTYNKNTQKKIEHDKDILKRFGNITNKYGWINCTVKDLFQSFGGGTPSRSNKNYWNGSISWVSSGDVKSELIENGSESITVEGLKNSSAKICPVGSVIVVVRSGILQHTLPVSIVKKEVAINQDIKCFNSGNSILNYWLSLTLSSKAKEILAKNREGTTVQSVKLETLKNFNLEVPPEAEILEIKSCVNSLYTLIDKIESHYLKAKNLFDKLPQTILFKAFSGKLVAQNLDDEPANVLLKRIKEDRARMKIQKK